MQSKVIKPYPNKFTQRWVSCSNSCPLVYIERLIYSVVSRRRCSNAGISRLTGFDKQTVAKYCQRLQGRSLIIRQDGKWQGLTPEGEAVEWFSLPAKNSNNAKWQDRLARTPILLP